MREEIERIRERLTHKETPGKKLHRRVERLARYGNFREEIGSFSATYAVLPDTDIRLVFQPVSKEAGLWRTQIVSTPTGEETIISYFKILPNGNTRRFDVLNSPEAISLLARYFDSSANMQPVFQEMLELLKREGDAKREMGISDWLDDGEIEGLLSLVNSKKLRGVNRP